MLAVMHRRFIVRSVLVVAAAATAISLARSGREPSSKDLVERGRYLVTAGACNDCHTPFTLGPRGPEPDMRRMLSGHPQDIVITTPPALPKAPWGTLGSLTNTAWAGPWGVSFTANLTPDDETGIGKWTERDFIETLRSGRHLGRGRPLLPPMPTPAVASLTNEDLSSIFAYLKSLPPIRNRVPDPLPLSR